MEKSLKEIYEELDIPKNKIKMLKKLLKEQEKKDKQKDDEASQELSR